MLKALFKKQFMEINTWLIQDRKTGKRRSVGGIVLLCIVYAALFLMLSSVFVGLGFMICQPFMDAGLGWLYFALTGLVSALLGVFGSIFTTYTTIYAAKDNELLLSMPIPPKYIIAARLSGVGFWSFVYTALTFLPTSAVYWFFSAKNNSLTAGVVAADLLLLLLISLFCLAFCCILGWLIAWIASKIKIKSGIKVILSILFIAVYYLFYSRAYSLIEDIVANASVIGEKIKGAAYPLYILGRAGEGRLIEVIIFALCVIAFSLLIFFTLSQSFIKLATSGNGGSASEYKKEALKLRSPGSALLAKESKRFLSSATYMLNCGLGTLFMPAIGILALVKADVVNQILSSIPGMSVHAPLIACAVICMVSSMNDITAPSVSLEGRNIWIVQSLPVTPWEVLASKLKLHILTTEVPLLFCSVCIILTIKPNIADSILIIAMSVLFVIFTAVMGLAANLRFPNLQWKNEVFPIKQSASVFISLFGSWLIIILLAVAYLPLMAFVSATVYLLICTALVTVADIAMILWIKNRGSRIFASL